MVQTNKNYQIDSFLWVLRAVAHGCSQEGLLLGADPLRRLVIVFIRAAISQDLSRVSRDLDKALCECNCFQEWDAWNALAEASAADATRVSMCRDMLTNRCDPSDAANLLRRSLEEHSLRNISPIIEVSTYTLRPINLYQVMFDMKL